MTANVRLIVLEIAPKLVILVQHLVKVIALDVQDYAQDNVQLFVKVDAILLVVVNVE